MDFSWITVCAFSDRGLVRSRNEDLYSVLEEDGCYMISDGMGGGSAGEIASQAVVEFLSDAVAGTAADSPGSRKYAVHQAICCANLKIREYARTRNYDQMGATLALVLMDPWSPGRALLCHVGDSRIYRFRRGDLELLTQDHTVGSELSALHGRGKYRLFRGRDDVAPADDPTAALLTRAIGARETVQPEWTETSLEADDLVLICSDGVSKMLPEKAIRKIFAENGPLDGMVSALSGQIREVGAKDNYTIVLCRIASEIPAPETPSEEEIRENEYLLKISEERNDHVYR